MVKENVALKSFKFVLKDIFLDVLYWPLWWYTTGTQKAAMRFVDTVRDGNQVLSVSIWVKNLFVPMFGQHDWQGRIISFFMRLVQIIFRAIALVFWIIFSMIVFFIWVALPLFILFQVLLNVGIFS
jgi:hypothetical protein